jgi:general secretion pathway protein G
LALILILAGCGSNNQTQELLQQQKLAMELMKAQNEQLSVSLRQKENDLRTLEKKNQDALKEIERQKALLKKLKDEYDQKFNANRVGTGFDNTPFPFALLTSAIRSYTAPQRTARINAAKAWVGLFKTPLEVYNLDIGRYPSTNQGLAALRVAPSDLPNPDKWEGPYLNKDIPLDPWGHPYQYISPGKYNPNTYDIWSLGPDGIDGTGDDIHN